MVITKHIKLSLIILLFWTEALSAQSTDPVEDFVGLHVLSNFASTHQYVTDKPSERKIIQTMQSLSWYSGFHQVVLVLEPGISMEVGGSLDPDHGLSSVYRNRKKRIHYVTREPPVTVEQMTNILLSFHRGDDKWKEMYIYE